MKKICFIKLLVYNNYLRGNNFSNYIQLIARDAVRSGANWQLTDFFHSRMREFEQLDILETVDWFGTA